MLHFQFLVEDMSGEILITNIMEKLIAEKNDISYDCKSFKGIGGLKKSNNVQRTKTNKLLNDLDIYLKGFDKSLKYINAVLVIVLDNDTRDTKEFELELQAKASSLHLDTDYTFCIAIEEMEAWLLGDISAIQKAYPDAKTTIIKHYEQDSICGTWEILANALYKGGINKFRKDCPTYKEIGKYKCKWAKEIGIHLDLKNNLSPSFRYFLTEITKRFPSII